MQKTKELPKLKKVYKGYAKLAFSDKMLENGPRAWMGMGLSPHTYPAEKCAAMVKWMAENASESCLVMMDHIERMNINSEIAFPFLPEQMQAGSLKSTHAHMKKTMALYSKFEEKKKELIGVLADMDSSLVRPNGYGTCRIEYMGHRMGTKRQDVVVQFPNVWVGVPTPVQIDTAYRHAKKRTTKLAVRAIDYAWTRFGVNPYRFIGFAPSVVADPYCWLAQPETIWTADSIKKNLGLLMENAFNVARAKKKLKESEYGRLCSAFLRTYPSSGGKCEGDGRRRFESCMFSYRYNEQDDIENRLREMAGGQKTRLNRLYLDYNTLRWALEYPFEQIRFTLRMSEAGYNIKVGPDSEGWYDKCISLLFGPNQMRPVPDSGIPERIGAAKPMGFVYLSEQK